MLERYIEVARVTCDMMGALRKLPIPKDRQVAIYLQRKREKEALADHERAARALLNALEINPDLVSAEPEARPSVKIVRSARPRTSRAS